MKIIATLAIVAALAGCTQGQPSSINWQAVSMAAGQMQNQIYQRQMLNMQRQQLYNASQRQTTHCSTMPNGFGGFQMVCP